MNNSLNEKWAEVCDHVAGFDDVNRPEFSAFMDRVQPQAMSDGFLLATVENDFLKKRIEQNFLPAITRALEEIYGIPFVVSLEVDNSMPSPTPAAAQNLAAQAVPASQQSPATGADQPVSSPQVTNVLTEQPVPKAPTAPAQGAMTGAFRSLTFQNFVIGESNRMAYSMAVQVAESPGQSALNPLFIYGKSGLGKTHLMRAIQNYVNETQPELVTVYADSEEIVSKYTEASMTNEIDKSSYNNFKALYEVADVLLIDDIQFLQGKTGTLNIVFQILNKLMNQGKQIVLSADRAPKNIDIEERYNSRFMQGGTIDIQPPEIETKLAIVKSFINEYKLSQGNMGFSLPEDVQMYVAENSGSNIRELKGAINRLIFSRNADDHEITVPEAAAMLENHFSHGMSRNVTIEDVQKEVESYYKVKHSEMVGPSRAREVMFPRQVAMYLCRVLLDRPYEEVGKKFDRDHTTVMHSVKKIEKLLLNDRNVQEEIEILRKAINNL